MCCLIRHRVESPPPRPPASRLKPPENFENGIISKIGTDLEDAAGLPVYWKPGHTPLLGLIDAHCHPYREPRLGGQSFRFGSTTLMGMHNTHANAQLQKKWAEERKDYPNVKSSHFSATIDGGWPAWVEENFPNNAVSSHGVMFRLSCTLVLAAAYINRAISDGADYVKLIHEGGRAIGQSGIVQMKEAVQAAVVKAAHGKGFNVVAHALSRQDNTECMRAGVDGLTHTFLDEPNNPKVIELYKKNNALAQSGPRGRWFSHLLSSRADISTLSLVVEWMLHRALQAWCLAPTYMLNSKSSYTRLV
ncbi:putative organophosphate acid anhydrase protein [Fonsecaea pedrosoi]|nr:putative organophosphate acid anhydrase protein [Fonsecaea pedrosoi]